MSLFYKESGPGSSMRILFCAACLFLGLVTLSFPSTPTQAGWAVFAAMAGLSAWLAHKEGPARIEAERRHKPRVFEGDRVPVSLRLRAVSGLPQTLVLVEDQFLPALSIHARRMIPQLGPGWEIILTYGKDAERHRGLYWAGPLRVWSADPLGLFGRWRELDCVTPIVVYPRARSLKGYRLLGPNPAAGPAVTAIERTGQGEEVLGVRPWRPGDGPGRIHWRTSARRGEWHVLELNTMARCRTAVFIDLTRRSRYGTGVESTTEIAIGCAVAILSEATEQRQWTSLVCVRETAEVFLPGSGLAHLHMMLDRLAVLAPAGETPFWPAAAAAAGELRAGDRAVFIVSAPTTDPAEAGEIARSLAFRRIAADVILIDESTLTRIHRDQLPAHTEAEARFTRLVRHLEGSGARVFTLRRGEDAAHLMPKGGTDPFAPGRAGGLTSAMAPGPDAGAAEPSRPASGSVRRSAPAAARTGRGG